MFGAKFSQFFFYLSVILFTGGKHPPGQTPPRQTLPPRQTPHLPSACWDTLPHHLHSACWDTVNKWVEIELTCSGNGTNLVPGMMIPSSCKKSSNRRSINTNHYSTSKVNILFPLLEATHVPVLNFWWCLSWFLKPEWTPLLHVLSPVCDGFLVVISCATPAA